MSKYKIVPLPSGNVAHLIAAQAAEIEQQPAAVDEAIDKARFERAPCYLCGYNGPGYYQPDTHPCAAKYHAALQPVDVGALRAEVAEWKSVAVAQSTEIERLRAEVSELRAARIAYASEFPEAKDGGPDTGNIHTNIRSLKARAEQLAKALEDIRSLSFIDLAMQPNPLTLTAMLGDIHQIADAALEQEGTQ